VFDGTIHVWKPSVLASGLGGAIKRSYSTLRPDEPTALKTNDCEAPPAKVTDCVDSTPPLRTVTGPENEAVPVFDSVKVIVEAPCTHVPLTTSWIPVGPLSPSGLTNVLVAVAVDVAAAPGEVADASVVFVAVGSIASVTSASVVLVGAVVSVGGTGVSVGGTGVSVGGTGVSVGGTGVSVGGIGVLVGGSGVGTQPFAEPGADSAGQVSEPSANPSPSSS
jgi:hypothetical protein